MSRMYVEAESANEGACLGCMLKRNRQIRACLRCI